MSDSQPYDEQAPEGGGIEKQADSLLYNQKPSVILGCIGMWYMAVSAHDAWDAKSRFGSGLGIFECPYTIVSF